MSLLNLSTRWRFSLGALACAGAMVFALYIQYFQHLEPCALCVLQRIAMIATGVVFLVGALHGPAGSGRNVYGLLAFLTAGTGAAIAGRHVWLQHLPPDQVPACGPTLDYLFKVLPWRDALSFVLRGEGNCAVINGQFLGVTLPEWTLLSFAALAAWALYSLLQPKESV